MRELGEVGAVEETEEEERYQSRRLGGKKGVERDCLVREA